MPNPTDKCDFPLSKNCDNGKSHISVGLGIEAINTGYKVRFITMADLIHTLKTQEITTASRNSIKRIVSSDLVIIDDLMMFMAMEKNEANLFFQLVNKLYGQTSIIITSNKGPEDWGELLGDPDHYNSNIGQACA
ncbi:ATP-binding protein [Desulfoscipio gibsoniae]|uniref:ATP-binding protein n=1 Tax=Desulfoscipio gibsoniae TaxID=102134 RepID=UPI001FE046A5|nr:ATP-binding protein [Desulfoscipio gibsoniae]